MIGPVIRPIRPGAAVISPRPVRLNGEALLRVSAGALEGSGRVPRAHPIARDLSLTMSHFDIAPGAFRLAVIAAHQREAAFRLRFPGSRSM